MPVDPSSDSGSRIAPRARAQGTALPSLPYRPEVDGLRALAVVPVVLFHGGIGLLSGGFVGVDVFFVISGYLITGILLREMGEGSYSIRRFYVRRAKRILPALFAMVAACVPAAWLILYPEDFRRFAASVAAVSAFSSNLWFWHEEGYFAAASELKPLIHTWSLAVEEQFYILFPPLLALVCRAGRRRALQACVMTALASFALCEYAAWHMQTANFYLAPTRAWELLAGSLCAFAGQERVADGKWDGALSWLGLGMVVAAVVLFDGNLPFPSHWALVPVVGTALLLSCARADAGAGRLLAAPPLVGIGLISYSAYLWHQPLLAFARLSSPREPAQGTMVALCLVAFVLAWLSWRFIELPFRERRYSPLRRRTALALGGSALALFGAVALYGLGTDAVVGRLERNRDPAIAALAASQAQGGQGRSGCPAEFGDDAAPCLLVAPRPGATTVALFGDSLAEAVLPGFVVAARRTGTGLVFGHASGCPPLTGIFVQHGTYAPDVCGRRAAQELAAQARFGFTRVFLLARWTLYTEDLPSGRSPFLLSRSAAPLHPTLAESREVMAEALARTVGRYRTDGVEVVLIRQPPQFACDLGRLVLSLQYARSDVGEGARRIAACNRPQADFDALAGRSNRLLDSMAGPGVRVVDLSGPLRAGANYRWSDGRTAWYHDFAHPSLSGALLLAPQVASLMAEGPDVSARPH